MSEANKPGATSSNYSIDADRTSPDMFSDDVVDASNASSEADLPAQDSETINDVQEWKGFGMETIRKNLGQFGYEQVPQIVASPRHAVLFSLPVAGQGPPRRYPNHQKDKWSAGYVRMPYSIHSKYPNNHTDGSDGVRQRWEVIQEALLRRFVSSHELEVAILSYNQKYAQRWDFSALHHFFSDVVDEEDAALFYDKLLPEIIQLALQLPSLITGAIPLLKRHVNAAISLSQLQVGSLLANAFLCTFPRRNSTNPQSEYAMYPEINFNRLFGAFEKGRYERSEAVMEKFKCIFHYFRRITSKAPEGVITIQRQYIPKENCPRWNRQTARLPPLHITSSGTIETEGAGLLQVDFANKYVGGGVLGWGCVQEEIRFVICPELMVSMLVTEALDDTEALIISGVERYSDYEGYSDTFKWMGDFVDQTPKDNSGRRRTSIVAIDALLFKQSHTQFTTTNIVRELNKAYVGFSSPDIPKDSLSAIATGNWGCGAFRGDPKLKVLLQLMAAAIAGRSMVYFTFGDTELRDKVADMYGHLIGKNIDVGQLFVLLCENQTCASNSEHSYLDFYHFLYKRSKMKPLTNYFSKVSNESTTLGTKVTKSSEIKIVGKSEGTQICNGNTSYFTSKAKLQEDSERQKIEDWLDEDFFDTEFSNDFKSESNSNKANVGSVTEFEKLESSKSNVEEEEEIIKGYNETVGSVGFVKDSESPSRSKVLKDRNELQNHLSLQDFNTDEMHRAKKPRLSGLELLGKDKNCKPVETKTLDDLTVRVNNINDGVDRVTRKVQKKISDFFT